jgi:hypothetical protein
MKTIGQSLMHFPPGKLKRVRDLEYYQGPLLSEFKSKTGEPYLYLWRESDQKCNRWLVFRTSRRDLARFLTGGLTLLDLIQDNRDGFVYLVDLDSAAEISSVSIAFLEQLPASYLPTDKSYYDEDLKGRDEDGISRHAILVEGDLDFQDLGTLPRKYRNVYSTLYMLGKDRNQGLTPDHQVHYKMKGGWVYKTMFEQLEKLIPSKDQPRLGAVQIASPGVIDMHLNDEVAAQVTKAVAQFKENAHGLSVLYDSIDRWVHGREPKKEKKDTKRKSKPKETSLATDKEIRGEIQDLCSQLGFIDYAFLNSLVSDTRQLAKIVLAYYRRLEDLFTYQVEGKATVV